MVKNEGDPVQISHKIFNLNLFCELDIKGITSGEDFIFSLDEEKIDEQSAVLKISARRKDNKLFTLSAFCCNFQVPIVDIQGLWSPACSQHDLHCLPWLYEKITAANALIPVVAFVNRSGETRLIAGLLEQTIETKVTVRLNESKAAFDVSFRRPPQNMEVTTAAWNEYLYLSCRPCDWFAAIRKYVELRDKTQPQSFAKIPRSAYEPVYCSWYAIHHAVNQEWVVQQAGLARELGFSTFIIDDGWFFPGKGEWGKYRFCGDWQVEPTKFPDMRGMVDKLHDMGIKVLLWIAPFMVGLQSQAFRQWNNYLMKGSTGEDRLEVRNLCPRSQKVHQHLAEIMVLLMKTYGFDGFKIDFVDFVNQELCDQNHSHDFASFGKGIDVCMQTIYQQLCQINPEVLIEFRQSYANLAGRSYATMFRSGDSPADYDTNRWRATLLRSFSVATPVHTDPIYWHFNDHLENVSRHLISSVFAVPMLSMDLLKIPPHHAYLIKKWMEFYQQNKEVLNYGKIEPVFENGRIVGLKVTGKNYSSIIGVFEDIGKVVSLSNAFQEVLVLNASNQPRLMIKSPVAVECEIFNSRLEKSRKCQILPAETVELDVQIGGLVKIKNGKPK